MADEFKKGDVVQLKSGGPNMTVTGAGKDSFGRQMVWCAWFDDKNNQQAGTFPPEAVKIAKE